MSETFTPLARSRSSYYCKGSPVHFVMVELFKMESTGEIVVTMTFKNLYTHPIRSFTAHYCCKDRSGQVLGEDNFEYSNLNVREGQCFGSDDGVFICDTMPGSVEVNLVSVVYDDGVVHNLRRCPPVALPALRSLGKEVREAVRSIMGIRGLKYMPEELPDGWRCACGAFNYNAGKGKRICSECGANKAELTQAVQTALRRTRPQQPMYDAAGDFPVAQGVSHPRRPHEYGTQ